MTKIIFKGHRETPRTHATHPWAVDVWEDQINRPGPLLVACQMFTTRPEADTYAEGTTSKMFHAKVRASNPNDKEFA